MPEKTITAIIAITIITIVMLFTMPDPKYLGAALIIIAGLGGLAIYKNHIPKI